MNSRKRIALAIDHQEPDRVPLDLGGSPVTGMHVSSVYKLRQALALDPPGTPVKVVEPYQMLGEIKSDLMTALGVDVVGLSGPSTMFGFPLKDWKPWTFFDGTPVLVPGGFNTEPEPNGDILMYPEGNPSTSPSGRMPEGGFYFDAIVRQPEIDEAKLDPAHNLEEFKPISEEDLDYYDREADQLFTHTDKAILGNFGGTGFGDIALVPGIQLTNPLGIRDITEWYISTLTRREYIWQVFEKQCEIGLANLQRIHKRVGEKISVLFITGTDFGTQNGPFISPKAYRDLYQPFHKVINNWVHQNTSWKTFIHSCGSVIKLYPDFIEAGFDIINPVQTSAAGMDPEVLATQFGDSVTFWGGGVDTQNTLPFGTPEDIRTQVQERMHIFGTGGGFVFNPIHNVQAGIPVENLLALYEAVNEYHQYSLG
ncbi:MAG: uroporphyrinogen decarboxylase family protein [Chloroflexota bacterium]|nr:uroporphyrinogen decarboxylase family protein [Chloroflexota bacterium]